MSHQVSKVVILIIRLAIYALLCNTMTRFDGTTVIESINFSLFEFHFLEVHIFLFFTTSDIFHVSGNIVSRRQVHSNRHINKTEKAPKQPSFWEGRLVTS